MSSQPLQASEAALETISKYFPIALVDTVFFGALFNALEALGFKSDNSIAIVNTCRDELARPLSNSFDKTYGNSFNLSGIAGILTAGTLGFNAAISHSPVSEDGKEKYVFFGSTHVAVDEKGVEGLVLREGRAKPSHACGAIVAIKQEIDSNIQQDGVVHDDNVEYGILKKKLFAKNLGANPTIFELTKATCEIITSDIEDHISKTVDPKKSDYVVITGVQIHAGRLGGSWIPDAVIDYIAPLTSYVVIGGERHELKTDGKSYFPEKTAA
ncbi:hypothetical protein O6H91_09G010300 [Diphasiastrum complanatum]|uniref:Uncharacterized protein n=2 Tax=Diphasiastrum complanatum TaxID=34168 RepID=A0ACC2CL95_DIPCM|nr:hypothetical protein O6H91_09G010300 [Diphasiastrum complanatum]KAJ7542758.1 hypothetical protein O6H91_09G010300 [Diphasiastrum complanatum]